MNFRHQHEPRNDYGPGPDETDPSRVSAAGREERSWRDDGGGTYGQGGYSRNEGFRGHEAYGRGGRHASVTQGGYRQGDWSQGGGYDQRGYNYGEGDVTGRHAHRMGQGGMMNEGRYDEPQQYYGVQGDRGAFSADYGPSSSGFAPSRAGGQYGQDPSRGYAPGSQIWEGRGRSQDPEFEPDYLHWRESQMRNLDRDYQSWRDERRQKFSQDFDEWRNRRASQASAEPATPADNPAVGDVSNGGTGRDDRKKT